MLSRWPSSYGWRRGEIVKHWKSGQRFKVTGFAPGGNAARDFLRLRPILRGGKLGKFTVRVSEYFTR